MLCRFGFITTGQAYKNGTGQKSVKYRCYDKKNHFNFTLQFKIYDLGYLWMVRKQ